MSDRHDAGRADLHPMSRGAWSGYAVAFFGYLCFAGFNVANQVYGLTDATTASLIRLCCFAVFLVGISVPLRAAAALLSRDPVGQESAPEIVRAAVED